MTVRSVAVKTGSILQIALATVSSTHTRGLQRFERMSSIRDDQQIAGRSLPRVFGCTQAYPTGEHVDGRFPRVLVLVEPLSRSQRDDGLTQDVLMAAVHGTSAPAALRVFRLVGELAR